MVTPLTTHDKTTTQTEPVTTHGDTTSLLQGSRGQAGDNSATAVPLPVDGRVAEGMGVLWGQVGAGLHALSQADAEEGDTHALRGDRGCGAGCGAESSLPSSSTHTL